MAWINVAKGRTKCRALLNAIMYLRVPQNAWIYFKKTKHYTETISYLNVRLSRIPPTSNAPRQ